MAFTSLDNGFKYGNVPFTSFHCSCTYGSRAKWRSLQLTVALNTAMLRSLHLTAALPTGAGQCGVHFTTCGFNMAKLRSLHLIAVVPIEAGQSGVQFI